MRYLIKVTSIWISILAILVFLAFLSSWNTILISVIVGAAVGFLPAFILNTLAEAMRWHLENIEKIYAPLKSEIDDLSIFFSEARKGDYTSDLFGYGKDRSKLLSMDVWLHVTKDNLYYRLRLDDKDLAQKLLSFYQIDRYIKS